MHITDWLTGVAAVVAVAISIIALLYARSSSKAAADAAEAAKRSADVAERDERRQLEDAEQNAVHWKVERLGNAAVKLWNIGDGPAAYDVWAEASEEIRVAGFGDPVEGQTIHRGTGVRIGAGEFGNREGHLSIRWRNRPDGPVQELTYQL